MPILEEETVTLICQRALALAEARSSFASLDEDSEEAIEARKRYDHGRRAVLEALDWRFARRRVLGAEVAAPVTPFAYPKAWAVPPECLRVRGVFDMATGTLQRMSREGVILYTEAVAAVQIVYTTDFTEPTLFPAIFTTALQFRLAADFSLFYARSVNRSDALLGLYRNALVEADDLEAGERSEDDAYADGPYVEAVNQPYVRIG